MSPVALSLALLIGCTEAADQVTEYRVVESVCRQIVPPRVWECAVRQELQLQLCGKRGRYRAGTESEVIAEMCGVHYRVVLQQIASSLRQWPWQEVVWLATDGRAGSNPGVGGRFLVLSWVEGIASALPDEVRQRLARRQIECKVKAP